MKRTVALQTFQLGLCHKLLTGFEQISQIFSTWCGLVLDSKARSPHLNTLVTINLSLIAVKSPFTGSCPNSKQMLLEYLPSNLDWGKQITSIYPITPAL